MQFQSTWDLKNYKPLVSGRCHFLSAGLGSENICILCLTRKSRSFLYLKQIPSINAKASGFLNANRSCLECKATKDIQNTESFKDIIGSES